MSEPILRHVCERNRLSIRIVDSKKRELGHFTLTGSYEMPMIFPTNQKSTCLPEAKWFQLPGVTNTPAVYPLVIDTGIGVDESLQGKGWARKMVEAMIDLLDRLGCPNEQQFHINVDASDGYWDHIGFTEGKQHMDHSRSLVRSETSPLNNLSGSGYEKGITFEELKRNLKKGGRKPRTSADKKKKEGEKDSETVITL